MDTELIAALRGALARRSDVELALLFGSRARGQAREGREGSDADVAVLGKGCRLDLLGLAADLGETAGLEVDVVDLAAAGYPLQRAVLRDGIALHQGSPGAEARWRSWAILETETDRPWFERMRDAYLRRLAESSPNG